jgi:uncharacterized protein (TIGR02996 family)
MPRWTGAVDPQVKRTQINLCSTAGRRRRRLARAFQTSYPGTNADLLLADALLKARQTNESATVLNKSFSARPNNAVLMQLVRLARLSNDNKRADELMRNWLAANPKDQGVRLEYAAFLLQQGDNARAVLQYQAVLKLEPNNLLALNNLGWLLQRNDPKRARTLLERALTLSPNSAMVADTLGWLKLQQRMLLAVWSCSTAPMPCNRAMAR